MCTLCVNLSNRTAGCWNIDAGVQYPENAVYRAGQYRLGTYIP
jgi:hypothetical protein